MFSSRLSNARTAPPPFRQARYPPPLKASATFGKADALLAHFDMYPGASKLEMFNLPSRAFIGSIVLFRLFSSHAVSLSEKLTALRMLGLVEGQLAP